MLMVSAGVFLTVFLYSFMKGAIGDLVDSSARFDTGHVKITTRAYNEISDQMPNDLALLGISDLMKTLKEDYADMTWTPRIRFAGLLDIPDHTGLTRVQGPVIGMGIDLLNPTSPEFDILTLKKAIVLGDLPRERNEALISEAFAHKRDITIGETATLICSTMNGSMSMHNFKVVGTIRFGMFVLDRSTLMADIEDIRVALDMADGASEVVGYTKDRVYADSPMREVSEDFNRHYSDKQDPFSPIMIRLGEQGGLVSTLEIANAIGGIIVLVFILAMSVVLWNAGLMNGIRRYGEVGVRLAMGESKGNLYCSMIFESLCIGIAGSILGTALGLAVSYWMQYVGIDAGTMLQKSTVIMSTVYRAKVTPTSYYIGFFPGLLASVIGTMFAGIGIYRRQTSQLFRELEV